MLMMIRIKDSVHSPEITSWVRFPQDDDEHVHDLWCDYVAGLCGRSQHFGLGKNETVKASQCRVH